MIIDASLIISSASLGLDMLDRLKDKSLLRKIDQAYKAALQEWCKNKQIRKKISSQFLDYGELVDYIKTNGDSAIKDPEYISFLKVWESKLRDDELTYSFINEIIKTEILSRQKIMSEDFKEAKEQASEEHKELLHKQMGMSEDFKEAKEQTSEEHKELLHGQMRMSEELKGAKEQASEEHKELLHGQMRMSEDFKGAKEQTNKEHKELINRQMRMSENFQEAKEQASKERKVILHDIKDIKKQITPQFNALNYSKPDDYIKRTVRDYIKTDSLGVLLRPQLYEHKYLIDYLIQDNPEKKIILYSEAQEGKSTEFQNLAYETQDSELFCR